MQSHSTDESPVSGDEAIVGSSTPYCPFLENPLSVDMQCTHPHGRRSRLWRLGWPLTLLPANTVYLILASGVLVYTHYWLQYSSVGSLDMKMTIDMAISQTNNVSLFLFSCSWFLYLILISSALPISYAFFILCPLLTNLSMLFFFSHFYTFPSTLIPWLFLLPHPPLLFTPYSSPFSHFFSPFLTPPQAVWDVSCVCRPAGPDPRVLQWERWKNPQLLQHSSPLPTVCQQQQTGVYLMN